MQVYIKHGCPERYTFRDSFLSESFAFHLRQFLRSKAQNSNPYRYCERLLGRKQECYFYFSSGKIYKTALRNLKNMRK